VGLNFFFPPECLGCGKEDFWICKNCIKDIDEKRKQLSTSTSDIKKIWALADYHQPIIEKSIKKIKFGYCQDILNNMTPFLREGVTNIPFPKNSLFCPVPLHILRKNNRGFNQAEKISQIFSSITNIPTKNLLKRKKNTIPQTFLNGKERKKNLQNAFSLLKARTSCFPSFTPIILVDDVATTFSTLNECAKVLREHGYNNIYSLVIARSKQ
jgi:ComF family protein